MACEHKNLQWVENVYRYNTVVWHVCLDCDAILYSRTKHKGLKGPQPNKRLQNCLVKKHERLDKLREEIKILRNTCPHLRVTIAHDGDTGNYDKSDDSYWADHTCLDCGKRWAVVK